MNIRIVTDLVAEPVGLTELKANMKIVDFTNDDLLITSLGKSSRLHLEKFTGLSFGVKTIELIIDATEDIAIPYGPVLSVQSVEIKDGYNSWLTLTVADEDYELVGDMLCIYYGSGTYRINYTAGYTSLPEDLKTDIKTLTAWQYQNRGMKLSDSVGEFPNYLNAWKYRKVVI